MSRMQLDSAEDATRRINESLESLKDLQASEAEMTEKRKHINVAAFKETCPVLEGTSYKAITWKGLWEVFGYEKPAHGFALRGDVCAVDKDSWQHNKYLRLQDTAGFDAAVSFGDVDMEDDVSLGSVFVLKSPRYHRFLDGMDGVRVEAAGSFYHTASPLTDDKRLQYALLRKRHGTVLFQSGKFETAVDAYEKGMALVEGMRVLNKEVLAQCCLNIAACMSSLVRHDETQFWCRRAVGYSSGAAGFPGLEAKAWYRMAVAARLASEPDKAARFLASASALEPTSPEIQEEMTRVHADSTERRESERRIFRGALNRSAAKSNVFLEVPFLRNVLFRSAACNIISGASEATAVEALGVKTVLDLSSGPTDLFTPILTASLPWYVRGMCFLLWCFGLASYARGVKSRYVFQNMSPLRFLLAAVTHSHVPLQTALAVFADGERLPVVVRCPTGNTACSLLIVVLSYIVGDDTASLEPLTASATAHYASLKALGMSDRTLAEWKDPSSAVLSRQGLLRVIERRHGSVQGYLEKQLGLGASKLALIRAAVERGAKKT